MVPPSCLALRVPSDRNISPNQTAGIKNTIHPTTERKYFLLPVPNLHGKKKAAFGDYTFKCRLSCYSVISCLQILGDISFIIRKRRAQLRRKGFCQRDRTPSSAAKKLFVRITIFNFTRQTRRFRIPKISYIAIPPPLFPRWSFY